MKELIETANTKKLQHYLNILNQKKATSLLCYSKTGYGKSFTVLRYLKETKTPHKYLSGYTTPLALYIYLYNHRDKLIVLDDLDGLFKNPKIISILKAVIYGTNGKRKVDYETTADIMGAPSSFEFTGSVVILTNELPERLNENFKSLLSRTISFELTYSHEEILKISQRILNKRKLPQKNKKEVERIIRKQVTPVLNMNFRLLDRLINFVAYNITKAEQLFMSSIKINEDLQLVWKLNKSGIKRGEQAREFCKTTGKHRVTFYRMLKQLNI